ncbi:esterase [Lactobacillus nasalidis]|uniref:Esterase n=1 Tax=Lactobacillus nasalidis TaxID=2797258 RepID=A0ABQ3W6C6_9LACO|nr:serine hydrolase domain-containing protein [Lactobacillus nasalidis]GHV97534.1 esterase [Lactobacillus nasalidis]GHV99630.1 esterase [Lactobacillus nasalidis]GHW00452.1 esterase [Lactobacillus nasalidis]
MLNFPKTQLLIESLVSERIVPGVNYALLKGDQVFASTLGFASIYPGKSQLSPFAYYDLASCTKVLATTALALQLKEAGAISFEDPLSKYVPEFRDDRVQLKHLLTHTSGIRGWIENRSALSGPELMKAIVNLPVTSEFNHVVRYADTNFVLLGLVLERLLGQPVQDLASQRIFAPAGLTETTFAPPKDECVPTELVDGQVIQGIVHDPKGQQLGRRCGSAGLFSTMSDLVKIGRGYMGVSDLLPLKRETIQDLYQVKTPRGLPARSWGWNLVFDPKENYPIIYHTGFTGTLILFDQVKQSGLILLTNRVHPSRHNQIFLTMRSRIIQAFLAENR